MQILALPRAFAILSVLAVVLLVGCGSQPRAPTGDPLDVLPVARFVTARQMDDAAQCIADKWQNLAPLTEASTVTLHPSFRGLIVDARAPTDARARSYVELYEAGGATRVDYFLRSFASDPGEDLRLRALRACL
ncbi:MAG: hypothetical protein ACRYG5_05220 [Janthinobacterium lividum]